MDEVEQYLLAKVEEEMVLAGIVEDKYDTIYLITAAAGPEVGGRADTMIEQEMAEEYF